MPPPAAASRASSTNRSPRVPSACTADWAPRRRLGRPRANPSRPPGRAPSSTAAVGPAATLRRTAHPRGSPPPCSATRGLQRSSAARSGAPRCRKRVLAWASPATQASRGIRPAPTAGAHGPALPSADRPESPAPTGSPSPPTPTAPPAGATPRPGAPGPVLAGICCSPRTDP
jgi:hypothetical protein